MRQEYLYGELFVSDGKKKRGRDFSTKFRKDPKRIRRRVYKMSFPLLAFDSASWLGLTLIKYDLKRAVRLASGDSFSSLRKSFIWCENTQVY